MAKFTLEDFTHEIKSKIADYKKKCTVDLYSGVEFANFNREKSVAYIEKIYELAKKDKPVVIFAEDPADYKEKFKQIHHEKNLEIINNEFLKINGKKHNEKITLDDMVPDKNEEIKVTSHYLFLCSSYHRVYLTWYKFIQDEFKIDHKNKELLDWLYANANNNIARCYFTSMFVLVLKMPKYIKRNEIGFNSVDSPAIEWENYGMYYINGRRISKEYFDKVANKTLTFDEFIGIENEDVKATIVSMIIQKFGNPYLMEFLNAKVVDEVKIDHTSGYSEIVRLWKTNKTFPFVNDLQGNLNQPYAWLELTCPSTKSVYLITTSAHFTSALEACKFHRPASIPMELKYDFEAFNN